MKKLFLLLFFLTALVSASTNYNGRLDTALVVDTLDSATVYFTKAFELSRGEDVAVLVKVDDDSVAGLVDDSVNFRYGYQLGFFTDDSAGVIDTAWCNNLIVIDSFVLGDYGLRNVGFVESDLSLTDYFSGIDTTSIAGYAYQIRAYLPKWAPYIRYWVEGLGEPQGTTYPLDLQIQHNYRLFTNVRRQ